MKDVMWWATVAAYWAVVVLCAVAAKVDTHKRPWKITAAVIALLAVNKQHDLTGVITKTVRRVAVLEHWYGQRARFQWFILLGIGIASLVIFIAFYKWTLRRHWTVCQRAVFAAAIYLSGFALARSVSLHAIDALLYRDMAGIKLNWVFELGGLAFAAACIVGYFRQKTKS